MIERRQRLPVGLDDFAKLRAGNYYYVDKTFLIHDLLYSLGEVNLFTRPRRFGKSLNMSMLRYFFEIGTDPALFDGLAISKETELCAEYLGQFPVVSVSMKTSKGLPSPPPGRKPSRSLYGKLPGWTFLNTVTGSRKQTKNPSYFCKRQIWTTLL